MTKVPVRYMERSRNFYSAQGYEKSYEWASYDTAPFTPLKKRLAQSTIALVTTAMPLRENQDGPKAVFSGSMRNPPDRLFTSDLSWDKNATNTEDLDSYFPIHHLQALEEDGRIGRLSDHFYCVPTEYSQRRTNEVDAPEILRRCREDGVDVALLMAL